MLKNYGLDDYFLKQINDVDAKIGRITAAYSFSYTVITGEGPVNAVASGKMLHADDDSLPVTGDWVSLLHEDGADLAVIQSVLQRKNVLTRKSPGQNREQFLAANVDYLCIVTACDETFSIQRVERYLTIAVNAGAEPVLVFSKSDLDESGSARIQASERFAAYKMFFTSSADQSGELSVLRTYMLHGKTYAFAGQSGAGKSTIINFLLGSDIQETHLVRDDGKGRHTTTARTLFCIPSGGIVIDMPGLREVGIWCGTDDIDDVFPEIKEFSAQCRYTDCSHVSEPGCAVIAAVENGSLEEPVYANYLKLRKEVESVEGDQLEKKRKWKNISKDQSRFFKESSKYR